MDLDEVVDPAAHLVAHGLVRGDRGRHRDHTVPGEEARDVTDPADIGVAVLFREAEALRQVLAHLVAVEELDPVAPLLQVRDHDVRDGALAGTRQAGEPETEAGSHRRAQVTGGPARTVR